MTDGIEATSDAVTTNVGGATVSIKPDLKTPSEQLKAAAAVEAIVTDARGRTITLRKPSVLAQFDIVEALGDTSRNQVYMAMVMPLLFVAAIDGATVAIPTEKIEIKALIQRLDEDGIQAVMAGVAKNFGISEDADPKNV